LSIAAKTRSSVMSRPRNCCSTINRRSKARASSTIFPSGLFLRSFATGSVDVAADFGGGPAEMGLRVLRGDEPPACRNEDDGQRKGDQASRGTTLAAHPSLAMSKHILLVRDGMHNEFRPDSLPAAIVAR
jgi:hypothetical protein